MTGENSPDRSSLYISCLTPRENQILAVVTNFDLDIKQAAEYFEVKPHTVSTYLSRIRGKVYPRTKTTRTMLV